jgi:tetratricopeptide (TPR) repeat protein
MNRRLMQTVFAAAATVVLICGMGGCAGKMLGRHSDPSETQLVIPDFPTAKEQFAFARAFQGGQITSPELEKRRGQMDKVAQYYNRVLVNFPNDPVYVPLTYLELGDCAAQSDYLDKAIQAYQHAMSISQEEFIQVRAQYSIAHIYDAQGRHVEAKQIYKRIIDQHKNSESGRVKDVLKRAYQRYMKVQEKPAGKTGR